MTRKKSSNIEIESAIEELESIIEQMEEGSLSLEESLKRFERGVKLTRVCQKQLKDAEQRVQVLIKQGEDEHLQPYQDED